MFHRENYEVFSNRIVFWEEILNPHTALLNMYTLSTLLSPYIIDQLNFFEGIQWPTVSSGNVSFSRICVSQLLVGERYYLVLFFHAKILNFIQ